MAHGDATKKHAKTLYGQGWAIPEIAKELGLPARTLRAWRDEEGWAVTLKPEEALDARISVLIQRGEKSQADWNELKRLNELRNAMLRREKRAASPPDPLSRRRGGKKGHGARLNDIGEIEADSAGPALFAYQRAFIEDEARLRFDIKSRQIGYTFGASWDALRDALRNGRNQIFLSASKAQVGVFRDYIKDLAREHYDLELKGSKERIDLHKDGALWASFIFLSTNTATAQSYHGNVWIDEACWIPQYETLRKVAGGMASQKRFRITIFSTPSTITHPAWQEFKRLEKQQAKKPSERISLRRITILDAIDQGCDLFDLEALREEYDETAFAQLFLCEPLDDELSVFKLKELEALQADPAAWKAPGAGTPVWIGYDPSRTTDSATLWVVVRLPDGRLRLYERESWKGKSIRGQAERIRHYTGRFYVEHIGIDVTGMGQGVHDLVVEFFPKATAINYTLENKVALVNCMRHLVSEKRLELPAGDTFLLHAFLAIKQATTGGGRITYKAGRTAETGHADAFFAAAHACQFEPIRKAKRRALII